MSLATRRMLAMRYGAVSVFNVVSHQILLNLANSGWGWSGGTSNVFAATVTSIPAYLLSRYWVWEVRGSNSLRAEVLPFWILSIAGLIVSTVLAELADRAFGSGVWVAAGSLFGYFVIWVVKFAVLDKMFDSSDALDEVVAS